MTRYLYVRDAELLDTEAPEISLPRDDAVATSPLQVMKRVQKLMRELDPGSPVEEPLFLVEQSYGTWRKATGDDLIELHDRFPRFLRGLIKPRK